MEKQDILSMTLPEIAAVLKQKGEPAYRAEQIFTWLHQKKVTSFEEMTSISNKLKQVLSEEFYINSLNIEKKLVSGIDNTVKYLYRLRDGETVETVLMRYHHANSLCISTQVGCRMGCKFCASTIAGFVRNLTPSELLCQIYQTERDSGVEIGSIVLMGIGEPLDNYDNVLRFLRLVSDPKGKCLSLRHLSLSTCGLVDRIRQLADEKLGLTLSVSIHASDDESRNAVMPVNRKYPIAELLDACRYYFKTTGRRISFEYAMISGVNDSPAHARALGERLRGMQAHVNLIPVNPVKERSFRSSDKARIERFETILSGYGLAVTVRRRLGADINAACGQLRREEREQGQPGV
ncbi:MAG: 23S rRNA (adenine(2503)-C(2))-methyltransferase RlmN [Oscillospiraceae bacterium]|nr:23S rRNA (adenine(2503)-C(2))-methyltransferase RlmN [Oscillospiraceae bacterium]